MNGFINGDFGIWQRSSNVPTGSGFRFGPDMWAVNSTGSTVSVDRLTLLSIQTDVPGNPKYSIRIAVKSVAGSDNFARFGQPIEDVRRYAGQSVTWSFYARADTAKDIAIELRQFFGSGTPASAPHSNGVKKVSLTTTWQRIDFDIHVASVDGKDIGPAGDDCLQAVLWLDAGSAFDCRTNGLGQLNRGV
jgi:hypothetical protein